MIHYAIFFSHKKEKRGHPKEVVPEKEIRSEKNASTTNRYQSIKSSKS